MHAILNYSFIIYAFYAWAHSSALAQSSISHDSISSKSNLAIPKIQLGNFSISGYFETYYCYDFAQPTASIRQPFLYNYNRHHSFSMNLALLQLHYQKNRFKLNFGGMLGNYVQDNMKDEWGFLKYLYQANIAFQVSRKKNIWLEAGILPSHIGFESAIGKENWNLSRSLLAENSPYYETGIKLSYTSKNQKWLMAGLLTNGWQRIYRNDGNNFPALGHQITYSPTSFFQITSSSYLGFEKINTSIENRFFHHLHSKINFHPKWALTTGFDIGLQSKQNLWNTWYAAILMAQWKPIAQLHLSARVEYFNDENAVLVSLNDEQEFEVLGYSFNLDYQIIPIVLWRLEGRSFYSSEDIFKFQNEEDHFNYFLTTAICVSF